MIAEQLDGVELEPLTLRQIIDLRDYLYETFHAAVKRSIAGDSTHLDCIIDDDISTWMRQCEAALCRGWDYEYGID